VANIKSQIKRNRQSEAAHERNKAVKSALKTAVRKFREAAQAGDADAAKGVIHKNQAANRKSAIHKQVSSL
jgi:small subunit ribosomal protein S20